MIKSSHIKPAWLGGRDYQQDKRVRYSVMPSRVVWSDSGDGEIGDIDALLRDDISCCNIGTGSGTVSLVLDFGQEFNGGAFLDIAVNEEGNCQVKTRVRFGESVSECMGQPSQDHAIHDVVLDFPSFGRHEFGCTGFRFVRLDFLEKNAVVGLRQVKAAALERPLEYKGSFESSDEMLNRVWQVGARTVHLCCQDYIYDGIKRDRLVWMGDMHPQVKVIAAAFGNVDVVRETLDHIVSGTDTKKDWMNGFSSYSIWWLLILWDWYKFTGDKDYLLSQREDLLNCVEMLLGHIGQDGREQLSGTRFIDWSMVGNDKAVAEGLQALTCWGMQVGAKLFAQIGDEATVKRCVAASELMAKVPGKACENKQSNSLRVLAGLADAGQVNRQYLQVDPYRGFSPWYGYYVLQARAAAGDYAGAMDLIRHYWGGMVQLGATSFWEHFAIDWLENAGRIDELVPSDKVDVHATYGDHCYVGLRHSLCHGWAGGPTAWLSEHVLGVSPAAPGCKKVIIKPNLGSLNYAKGTVPTPHGIINVSHERGADGAVKTDFQLPSGVEVANG